MASKPVEKLFVSLSSATLTSVNSGLATSNPKPTPPLNQMFSSAIIVNPSLFHAALVTNLDLSDLTSIIINLKDSITKTPIYKSDISIIGINNTFFKEIESDKEGLTEIKLPIGNYKVTIVKDGYRVLEGEIKVENKNTISKEYNLLPDSVNYDSFFLIGMICEKLPKIPK
jgi:hypothetical protein